MSFLSTSDIAWILSGAFGAGASVGAIRVLKAGKKAGKTASHSARSWEAALVATEPVGSELHDVAAFERLVASPDTRGVAILALANAARLGELENPLSTLSYEAGAHIFRWLCDQLGNADAGVRAEALEVAAVLRMRSLRGRLMAAARDPDNVVRVSACRALAIIDPRRAIGELLRLVETEGEWTVDLLADIIERNGVDFIDPIISRVESWSATPALIALLASTKAPTGESALVAALDRQDHATQIRAAVGLGAVRSQQAVPTLQRLLQSSNQSVRSAAVRALGAIGEAGALSDLTQALGDESRPVRFGAATSLLSTPGGREVLMKAAKSGDPFVAEAASLALCQTVAA